MRGRRPAAAAGGRERRDHAGVRAVDRRWWDRSVLGTAARCAEQQFESDRDMDDFRRREGLPLRDDWLTSDSHRCRGWGVEHPSHVGGSSVDANHGDGYRRRRRRPEPFVGRRDGGVSIEHVHTSDRDHRARRRGDVDVPGRAQRHVRNQQADWRGHRDPGQWHRSADFPQRGELSVHVYAAWRDERHGDRAVIA